MSSLYVALSSFWQLARHWQQGEAAKLEISCEAGSLSSQLMISTKKPCQLFGFDHCDFVSDESLVRHHMSIAHKPFQCEYCNF